MLKQLWIVPVNRMAYFFSKFAVVLVYSILLYASHRNGVHSDRPYYRLYSLLTVKVSFYLFAEVYGNFLC